MLYVWHCRFSIIEWCFIHTSGKMHVCELLMELNFMKMFKKKLNSLPTLSYSNSFHNYHLSSLIVCLLCHLALRFWTVSLLNSKYVKTVICGIWWCHVLRADSHTRTACGVLTVEVPNVGTFDWFCSLRQQGGYIDVSNKESHTHSSRPFWAQSDVKDEWRLQTSGCSCTLTIKASWVVLLN